MQQFNYYRPESIEEAIELLDRPGAKVFAGGTDMVPRLKKGLLAVEAMVDLKRIPDLGRIEAVSGAIHIGPLATHADITVSEPLWKKVPILPQSALTMAGPQIRNMGTIGGNICNASPAGDLLPGLICLEAEFELSSGEGKRRVAAADFFTGPGETVLRPGEILSDIIVPVPESGSGAVYLKLGRRNAMEIAQVGVAALVRIEGGKVGKARIVLGAVAPVPMRAISAEEILTGIAGDEDSVTRAADAAAESCRPIDDVRTTAEYRREMVKVLTRRAVPQAMEEARR